MVYGAHAGAAASREALTMADQFRIPPLANCKSSEQIATLDIADIRNSLKSLMWRKAGVHRSQSGLKEAEETVEQWCHYVLPQQFSDSEGWELQNMLTVAYFIITAALAREETRGVHQRIDFEETNDSLWRRHLEYQRQIGELH
jgi:L-aspartate oxidase